MAKIPAIALIGPPNVGKSTLFNTVIGKRIAITGPKPGTTRDRAYALGKWDGREFILVDTGGLARKSEDPLERSIIAQAELAMREADAIIFVVDGKAPVTAATAAAKELKTALRKDKSIQPKVFLVANKIDGTKNIDEVKSEFIRLGLGNVFVTSALTGRGVGDLLEVVVGQFDKAQASEEKTIFANVAIVGKPNVGKSTLLNQLAGYERVIVSPVPGTTRASVDIKVDFQGKILRFIDTAGMRRRARIEMDVEEYALFQSIKAIENSDVVVLLLDSTVEPTRFELTIGGRLKSSVKGIVVAINKIDLIEDKDRIKEIETAARSIFPFLKFSRVVPISAKDGLNIPVLMASIVEAKNSRDNLIEQKRLTGIIRRVLRRHPPVKLRAQKKPVVYGLEQIHTNPPVFNLIVNEPPAIHFSYIRHLENELRKAFGFSGTAIKIRLRKPHK